MPKSLLAKSEVNSSKLAEWFSEGFKIDQARKFVKVITTVKCYNEVRGSSFSLVKTDFQ